MIQFKYILDKRGVWHIESGIESGIPMAPMDGSHSGRIGPQRYVCGGASAGGVFSTNDIVYVTRSKKPFCAACDRWVSGRA
jgi:hypothetical protein